VQSPAIAAPVGHRIAWPVRCELDHTETHMLMFKRSQIYIGLGLAAIFELAFRFAH
jgi:hypothetical protein